MENVIEMTTEQMAKLIAIADNESRRLAKRYIRQRGGAGRADELDAALEIARANPAAVEAAEWVRQKRAWAVQQIKLSEAKFKEIEKIKRIAKALHAAARGRMVMVVKSAMDDVNDLGWVSGHLNEAEENLLEGYTYQASEEEIAEEIDETMIEFDSDDLKSTYESIVYAVYYAQIEAARKLADIDVASRAVENGRWLVNEYYRKTLSQGKNSLSFDTYEDAVAYRTSLGDYSTCAYGCEIVDTGVDDDE